MACHIWTRRTNSTRLAAHRSGLHRRRKRPPALRVEALEDRSLMAVFAVDTTADAIDATPGDGLCATASGQCSLRAAIMEANALPGADEVILPTGTYRLIRTGADDLSVTGDLDVSDDLTITGWSTASTTIVSDITDRILHVHSSAAVTLNRVTVAGGESWPVANSPNSGIGGGILNNGVLTLTNTILANNRADLGGGIANYGTMSVSDSTFRLNAAEMGGGVANFGSMSVSNATIADNRSDWGSSEGAGIQNNGGTVSLTNSTISGNGSFQGGGIGNNGGTVSLTNSTVRENLAFFGGGMLNSHGAISLTNSTVSFNRARNPILYPFPYPTLGGGIHSTGGQLTLVNTTISHNDCAPNPVACAGGGIFVNQSSVVVRNSTITRNSAGSSGVGAGISAQTGLVNVSGSVVAGNNNHQDVYGQFASQGFNLIGSADGSSGFGAEGDLMGTGANPIDPRLGPLQDNGGPTYTHLPAPDSPAIDAGDPDFTPSPYFDQRGAPFRRLQDGNGDQMARIDIGAVEVQSAISHDGDFNDDGRYDLLDIDALVAEIAAGANNTAFDVNGDGMVDLADRDWWLGEAGEVNLGLGRAYLLGDANLDGTVDGSDYGIWNANKFTSVAAWSKGDFTADGNVDGSDFSLWNANKFTSSSSVIAVREFSAKANPIAWVLPIPKVPAIATLPSPLRNLMTPDADDDNQFRYRCPSYLWSLS